MKRILIALTAVALSCSAIAQTKTTVQKKVHHTMHKSHDCMMMEDGKMMTMMNGKEMPMTESKTLSNGTVVMTDGTCKMKDGKTVMLKDDQCIMMDGKIMPRQKEKMKM